MTSAAKLMMHIMASLAEMTRLPTLMVEFLKKPGKL
jgi:hypothetical protein